MNPPIVCSYCERTRAVNRDGRVRVHQSSVSRRNCPGSGTQSAGHHLAPVTLRRDPATGAWRDA